MVFFRPTQPEQAGAARQQIVEDFGPLAFMDAGAGSTTVTAAPARSPFVVPETVPSVASRTATAGTIWRAGILEELRNPRPKGELGERIVCSADDTGHWLQARRQGVTATDAARLATAASVRSVLFDKVRGGGFVGNAFTEFGRKREPVIVDWMREHHGIDGCGLLVRAAENSRHLATPDGLSQWGDEVVLAEIKTTNKPWSRIPRNYLRQVWWQQYVVGAQRTLFVWEVHEDFVVQGEPNYVWIERDDAEIAKLVDLADQVLEHLDAL